MIRRDWLKPTYLGRTDVRRQASGRLSGRAQSSAGEVRPGQASRATWTGRGGSLLLFPALALALGGGLFLSGCTTPIAGALDEGQANRVLVALERAGVGSEKEVDPAVEGKFRILVLRDDAPHALAVLRDEDLPSETAPGLLDAIGKGSLLPSPMAEHAQFVAGLSGELERTLSSIDGVLSARVHLSLPWNDALSDTPRSKPSASVLIKHRSGAPPIDASAITRLVAGAAPALSPNDVAVVLVPKTLPSLRPDQSLARFGPLWVSRGSISALRTLAAICIALDLALFGMVMVLWSRARRLRVLASSKDPQEAAQGRASA